METYRYGTILPISSLCSRCQTIPFDDKGLGGREELSEDGLRSLHFGPVTEALDLPINWHIEDDWPSLTHLNQRLSDSYCPVCRWIKDALVQIHVGKQFDNFDAPGFVKASLAYKWSSFSRAKRPGLSSLVMNLQFTSSNNRNRTRLTVDFAITGARIVPSATSPDILGAWPVASWLNLRDPICYLDQDYVDWMKAKLASCEDHTRICHPLAQEHFLPDRLIDISSESLKIISGAELSWERNDVSDRRYAALSYCWGKREDAMAQAKLTTANMTQRFSGFQFSELTVSIQDAVKVTRALGLKYLWVDALCIIQGMGSDWDVQCAIMDKIYRNANITICALGSASCRQGFLNKRPKITLPFNSRIRPDIVGSFALDQPVVRETGYCLDVDSMDYDVAESNWDDRGWTFQEMVLSTRMLMFGKRSVHFSCSEFHETKQSRRWAGSESFQFPSASHMKYEQTELYDRWASRLVTAYTDRTKTLTVGTDVLPAFAGTASLFQTLIGDQYLAGLWKGDLHRGLIWSRYEPANDQVLEDGLLSAQQYMGPSWSWARLAHLSDGVSFPMYQVGGYAVFSHTRCRPEYVLNDITVSTSEANPFGRVLNGTLQLTTKLYQLTATVSASQVDVAWADEAVVQLRINDVKLADVKVDFESMQLELAPSGLEGRALKFKLVLIGSTLEENIALHLIENDDECVDAIEGAGIHRLRSESRPNNWTTSAAEKDCGTNHMPLGLEDSETHMPCPRLDATSRPMTRHDRTAYGLVVYPAEETGQFYRVGIFFSTPESGGGLGLFDRVPEGRISIV